MGVPKFYRWISERYPCLSEVVKEFQLPEFDNLYLDMNGVVHTCSHPEDDNPHFRITEEQIFKDICHYIEFLFRMIKPRKVFFMAIDGVAPRAKMNQQRGRRFRSAREAEELIKKAQEKGETLPTEKRFDSNCITPGTPFMVRLQDHLKYFVVNKVTHDPLWQGPQIILSGHETPGEGEHKVMDFIRYSRSQPGHDPNTRHCLYGLDADLIMLGLTSHEPHFALLREEVRFGGKKDRNRRPSTPEETTFHLLHLSLMREYLDYEFSALKTTLPFEYDMERIIDDWILMGFLVGNDFIPHLPHLHIHHDALPLLWKNYMEILPTLDGYLNEGGRLNLRRFEKYLGGLAKFDREQFSDQYVDMKYLEGKRGGASQGKRGAPPSASGGKRNGPSSQSKQKGGKGNNPFAVLEGFGNMDEEYNKQGRENGQLEARAASFPNNADDTSDEDDYDTFDDEFSAHKRDYYITKMGYENVTPEVLRDQAYQYVRAIQWILLYYYEGVQSWSWYYPHHYAPYISDVRDFAGINLTYEMSEPFKPFEQLMAVLPAASKDFLPAPLQELMTNENSPVNDYYPVNFKTDLNGKQQDWEAVVLIPFIDEHRLLGAMRTKEPELTQEERQRNSHGPCYLYQHSPESQGTYPSSMPGTFPDIAASHAKVCAIPKFHFCLPPDQLCRGLMPGTKLDVYFPGFPTLKHIPHDHRLEKRGVKVFQMNSRGFNTILKIKDLPERSLGEIANELLGQTTWVGWPHLHEAKVYAVADEKFRIELEEQHKKGQAAPVVSWNRKELAKHETDVLYKDASSIKEKYHDRFGVEVGKTTVLIYAGNMTGRKYVYTSQGRVSAEKQFSVRRTPFALQTTCKDIQSHAPDDMHFRTMDELFPVGASVFMLGNPHYACQGEVLEIDNQEGRVRVSFSVLQEPDFSAVCQGRQYEDRQYMPGYVAAQRLGISKHLLARITGTILILRGDGGNTESKANIGLNLKFTKRGEEVPGYTKKTDDGWLYSDKCLETINKYLAEFSDMLEYIATSHTGNSDIYTEVELFPEESGKTLKETLKFLEELPSSQVKSMKSGANILGDSTMLAVESAVDEVVELNKKRQKKVKMQVKPHLIYRPLPNQGTLEPDPGTVFEMLDRVVVVKMGYSVPFGLRGTVIGIHPAENPMDTMLDVIFDKEFVGGILLRCSTKRGYRVPPVSVLNLTHGETRKHGRQQKQKQAAAPPPTNPWQQKQTAGHGYQGNRQGQGQGSYSQGQGQGSYSQGQGQGSYSQGQGQGSYSSLMRNEGHRQGGGGEGGGGGGYSMMTRGQDPKSGYNVYGFQPQAQAQAQPQFVTPKLATSPPKASRVPPSNMTSVSKSDNSDFTNIWNQLLQSNIPGGPVMAPKTSQPGGMGSPIFNATSLQSAAEKLGKIAPPSADSEEEEHEPPTGILVDLSESGETSDAVSERAKSESPSSGRGSKDAKTRKMRIITNSNRGQPKAATGQAVSDQKSPNVLELFQKAEKVREAQSKSPSQPEAQTESVQAFFDQAAAMFGDSAQSVGDSDKTPASKSQSKSPSQPEAQTDRVQAMFELATRAVSMSADPEASSAELNSLFAALQTAPKSTSPSNAGASAQPPSEDGSAALRQMLKIGVEDNQSSQSVSKPVGQQSTYGRQVSLQELFDVAKQAPASSMPETVPETHPHPQQQAPSMHGHQQQQQQVRPPQPLLPPPGLLAKPGAPGQVRGKGRSPVDDLALLCQLAGQLPGYDFNFQHKQKGFISLVTIPGGARFEGSLCPSREEAAESAASMALLCLQAQMRFPGQGMPWMQRPAPGMGMLRPGQRLLSPNSAFSPVANPHPLMRFGQPMFNQPPPNMMPQGQRGRQPLLSQPPPPFSSRGPHPHPHPQPILNARAPHSQASHMPVNQGQLGHPRPANQSVSPSEGRHLTNQEGDTEKGREGVGKSSTEAFIPMQVTRKQRRKEETPEKHHKPADATEEGQYPVMSAHAERQKSSSKSPSVDSVNNNAQGATSSPMNSSSHSSSHLVREQKSTPKNKESDSASASKDHGSDGKGKKRRPRIAANFNFDSPK
ncbi:5'-3' exoribonuclease 1-like isoform X3 [Littorina saxatilis]|uniref:5'-3' exoribonuclease 1-like isoform X3 n=1 Tax=Littorina saxatilis TaxID=31220 RepID=UPI0038B5B3BD